MPRPTKKATKKNVLTMPVPAATTQPARPTSADVARRAFELYCQRGRQDGHDVEDWLQAERELLTDASSSAA
jgi:DUF2934 family protein